MGHFPLQSLCGAAHRWCCFKLYTEPCRLKIGCDVVLTCVVLFQAQCVGGGYCTLFSGVLSQPDVRLLVYVTGHFVRTVTVPPLRDLHIPTVIHLWTQLFCSKVWAYVVEEQTQSLCLHVWLTCSVCSSCLSGFASWCLLSVGKHTPSHWPGFLA